MPKQTDYREKIGGKPRDEILNKIVSSDRVMLFMPRLAGRTHYKKIIIKMLSKLIKAHKIKFPRYEK